MKKKHIVISFIGCDGAGKSTLISEIIPILKKNFGDSVYYEHMRPNKLPSLAKLFGLKNTTSIDTTKPHASSSSGFIDSLLRWSYYMLDYLIGYFLKVYLLKFRLIKSAYIFDRYYYDYLLDSKRTRVSLPKFLLKFGQSIIPEPDIIFCLIADPDLIFKRKPELSLVEIERQVKELKIFCKKNKHARLINTGDTVQHSVNDCNKALNEIFNL